MGGSGDSAHTVQMTVQKTSKSMMGIEALEGLKTDFDEWYPVAS